MNRNKALNMNELRNSTFVQGGQHWKVLEWIPKDMEYRCQSLDTGLVCRFDYNQLLLALMRESWEVHDDGQAYYDLFC